MAITVFDLCQAADAPKVAILREQGSNGDREMAAAFTQAGFQVRGPRTRTLWLLSVCCVLSSVRLSFDCRARRGT